MDETKEKKPPLDREEFKLLSGNERKFIENPTDLLKDYKSPDAMARQYNNRIKYRVINAIIEIAWLCDKLPEDRIEKIFSDDRIEDIFKITEKALDVADWKLSASLEILERIEDKDTSYEYYKEVNEESKRSKVLEEHVKNLMPHYLPAREITALEEMMKKHINVFSGASYEISKLNSEISDCLRKSNSLSEFIKEKGLEREFETYQSDLLKKQDVHWKNIVKLSKTPDGREQLKSKYCATDELIEFLKKMA
jgi:hypothetical protein